MSEQAALFDLPGRGKYGDPGWTDPDPHCHVLMPCMAYACGGDVLQGGTFVLGPSREWDKVTCPECLGLGREALREECQRQQGAQA